MNRSFVENNIFYEIIDGVLRRAIPTGDGVYRSWHPNGTLAAEGERIAGKNHGLLQEWHDNGALLRQTPLVNGLKHGTIRQWNRHGQLLGEFTLNMGRGTAKEWADDGKLISEHHHLGNGAVIARIWDDLGKLRHVYLWDGKPTSRTKFHAKLNRRQQ